MRASRDKVLSGFRSGQPTPSGCFGKCRLGGRVTPPGRCVHLTAYNTSRKILDARTEQSSAEASGYIVGFGRRPFATPSRRPLAATAHQNRRRIVDVTLAVSTESVGSSSSSAKSAWALSSSIASFVQPCAKSTKVLATLAERASSASCWQFRAW